MHIIQFFIIYIYHDIYIYIYILHSDASHSTSAFSPYTRCFILLVTFKMNMYENEKWKRVVSNREQKKKKKVDDIQEEKGKKIQNFFH